MKLCDLVNRGIEKSYMRSDTIFLLISKSLIVKKIELYLLNSYLLICIINIII